MKKNPTVNITFAGLFAAIIFLATYVFKFPLPNGYGYLNFGDGFILLSAVFIGPLSIPAAAVGSMLADLISGYAVYAPATFIIKGLVALTAWLFIKLAGKKFWISLLGFILAEAVMVAGYFVFEAILYSVTAGAANVIFNTAQGIFGVVIGTITFPFVKKLSERIQ